MGGLARSLMFLSKDRRHVYSGLVSRCLPREAELSDLMFLYRDRRHVYTGLASSCLPREAELW